MTQCKKEATTGAPVTNADHSKDDRVARTLKRERGIRENGTSGWGVVVSAYEEWGLKASEKVKQLKDEGSRTNGKPRDPGRTKVEIG